VAALLEVGRNQAARLCILFDSSNHNFGTTSQTAECPYTSEQHRCIVGTLHMWEGIGGGADGQGSEGGLRRNTRLQGVVPHPVLCCAVI
jgi:hypothetical protein